MSRGACSGRHCSDSECGIRPPPPANGEFDQHQRKYDQCQAEKIEEHEGSAAIGADLIWEFPYAPQSDCGADRCQNETCRTGPEITRLGHWAIPVCVPLIPSRPIDSICFSSVSAAHKTLVEFLFNGNSIPSSGFWFLTHINPTRPLKSDDCFTKMARVWSLASLRFW